MAERRMRTATAAARGTSQKSGRSEQGRAHTTTSVARLKEVYHETDREETLEDRIFEEGQHPARVRFSAGLTINLGDFQSLRLDCSVELPCLPSEIVDAHERASDFVAARIAEEENIWTGKTGTSKSKGKRG